MCGFGDGNWSLMEENFHYLLLKSPWLSNCSKNPLTLKNFAYFSFYNGQKTCPNRVTVQSNRATTFLVARSPLKFPSLWSLCNVYHFYCAFLLAIHREPREKRKSDIEVRPWKYGVTCCPKWTLPLEEMVSLS